MDRMDDRGARVVVAEDKEMSISSRTHRSEESIPGSYAPLSEDELTRKRKESWEYEIYSEKRSGLKGFVRESVTIVISMSILLLHWRVANRQKQSTNQASGTPKSGTPS